MAREDLSHLTLKYHLRSNFQISIIGQKNKTNEQRVEEQKQQTLKMDTLTLTTLTKLAILINF